MNTGAPIGSGLNIPLGQDPLAKYDPATQQVRPMSPVEQAAATANIPSGTNARSVQQSAFGNAVAAQKNDPNGPQAQQMQQLSLEHPGAFAGLAQATGRRGFARPRKPGAFRP